jgi:acyl carrier protein
MVPSIVVFLPALPHTTSGKIDRKALPKPEDHRPDSGEAYVAPRTAMEALIAEAWRELLHVDKVGVNDTFFDLGGHSLLATQLINKLKQTCFVDVSLRDFLSAPTVAALAQLVEANRGERRGDIERIVRIIERVRPLSEQQARALLEQRRSLRQ